MNYVKSKLSRQLLWLVGLACVVLLISLGVVLPKMLIPVAESNIYSYLSEPLKFVNRDIDDRLLNTEIAYIYVVSDNIVTSDNINDVIAIHNFNRLLSYMKKTYGKFNYHHKTYYYYMIKNDDITKYAISNDTYIHKTKSGILSVIFPIVLGTFFLIGLILVLWSSLIVRKIEKLKNKIDNIEN